MGSTNEIVIRLHIYVCCVYICIYIYIVRIVIIQVDVDAKAVHVCARRLASFLRKNRIYIFQYLCKHDSNSLNFICIIDFVI